MKQINIKQIKLGPLTTVDDFINSKSMYPVFQPVISLKDASVAGYECFIRFDAGDIAEDNSFFSPSNIFAQKKIEDNVWFLDKQCLKIAVKTARAIGLRKKLFVNLNAASFYDKSFQKDYILRALQKYGIENTDVIIEISESDFDENTRSLICDEAEYLRSAGAKIALDNMGRKNFGMKNIYDLNPDYIKLDRLIVENVENDRSKQEMIRSLLDFAGNIGAKVIATGVESGEELKKLVNLGVGYAQGFFIGEPDRMFTKATNSSYTVVSSIRYNEGLLEKKISESQSQKDKKARQQNKTGQGLQPAAQIKSNRKIGEFCIPGITFPPETPVVEVLQLFQTNPDCLLAVAVDAENKVLGTITRSNFLALFSSRYGFSLYSQKTIGSLMKKDFLSVDENETVIEVSQKAMLRDEETIYSPIVIESDGKYKGIATVKRLLDALVNVEVAEKTQDLMTKNKILLQQQQIQLRDMKMAELVQKSFYCSKSPDTKNWEIAFFFKPMASVSGDVYDFYVSKGREFLGCSLFDVSGHGVASGLVGILSKYLAAQTFKHNSGEKLDAMLKTFNKSLIEAKGMVENYLTGVFIRAESKADCAKIEYVNAGHPDVMIKRAGQKTAILGEGKKFRGSFLGIDGLPDGFKTVEEKIGHGTYFLLYTDCLVESRNLMGFELEGSVLCKVFDKACGKNGEKSAEEALRALMDSFRSFTEGIQLKDDLTVIVLKYK